MTDDELQKLIEEGDSGISATEKDAEGYRLVFESLNREPLHAVRPGFADRVMAVVYAKATRREMIRDRWWLVAGILGITGAFIYAFVSMDITPSLGIFSSISGYWLLIVFGGVFVMGLNVVEKIIQRKRSSVS